MRDRLSRLRAASCLPYASDQRPSAPKPKPHRSQRAFGFRPAGTRPFGLSLSLRKRAPKYWLTQASSQRRKARPEEARTRKNSHRSIPSMESTTESLAPVLLRPTSRNCFARYHRSLQFEHRSRARTPRGHPVACPCAGGASIRSL